MRLNEFMLMDPLETPVEADESPGGPIELSLQNLFPLGIPAERSVCLSHRASTPKTIIDAKADGVCERCREATWMSPSSKRVAQELFVVCTHCLAEGWARLGMI